MIDRIRPMRRILVPTDFSDLGNQAIPIAERMVADSEVELHLIHVDQPIVAHAPAGGVAIASPATFSTNTATQLQVKDRLDVIPISTIVSPRQIKRSVVDGEPASAIVDYARENEVDLIVMTTHGNTGLTRLLMGSVAETVVRMAECPVLTLSDHSSGYLT